MNDSRFFYDHASVPVCSLDHGPLAGLRHRTVIDVETGSRQLALWQEEHEAGFVVPLHRHDCEEIIVVLEGQVHAGIDNNGVDVGPGQSFLIPAWALHGFEVISDTPVKLLALFASSNPRIFRQDGEETTPPWRGGTSDHLQKPA